MGYPKLMDGWMEMDGWMDIDMDGMGGYGWIWMVYFDMGVS